MNGDLPASPVHMDAIALESLLLWDAMRAQRGIQRFSHELAYIGCIQLWRFSLLCTVRKSRRAALNTITRKDHGAVQHMLDNEDAICAGLKPKT